MAPIAPFDRTELRGGEPCTENTWVSNQCGRAPEERRAVADQAYPPGVRSLSSDVLKPDVFDAAIQAVTDACQLARRIQTGLRPAADGGNPADGTPRSLAKSDASPVTVADFAIQSLVASRLERVLGRGRWRLVGEESAAVLRDPTQAAVRDAVIEAVQAVDRDLPSDDVLRSIDLGAEAAGAPTGSGAFWTIDPIDGTKGFLRGEQYAICLAAIEAGEVIAAILGCPNIPEVGLPSASAPPYGILLVAERGAGCWQRSERAPLERGTRVRRHPVEPDGELVLCESVEARSMAPVRRERLLDAAGLRRRPVQLDSQCKYALVARGDADIYLRLPRRWLPFESIWDHASGILCVEEAGGRTSDLEGRALDFGRGRSLVGNRGVIACAAEIHQRLVKAAAEVDLDPQDGTRVSA